MKDYIWIRQLGMSLQVSGSLIMAITFAVQHWRVHFKHVKEPNFSKPGKTSRWLKAEFGLTLLSIARRSAGFFCRLRFGPFDSIQTPSHSDSLIIIFIVTFRVATGRLITWVFTFDESKLFPCGECFFYGEELDGGFFWPRELYCIIFQ